MMILTLSGTVFSADPERGYQVARRIHTGNGREGGPEDLEAFVETKTIYRVGTA